jgi:hypothetical protein
MAMALLDGSIPRQPLSYRRVDISARALTTGRVRRVRKEFVSSGTSWNSETDIS